MQGGFAVQATTFCVHAGHTHTRHQLWPKTNKELVSYEKQQKHVFCDWYRINSGIDLLPGVDCSDCVVVWTEILTQGVMNTVEQKV